MMAELQVCFWVNSQAPLLLEHHFINALQSAEVLHRVRKPVELRMDLMTPYLPHFRFSPLLSTQASLWCPDSSTALP